MQIKNEHLTLVKSSTEEKNQQGLTSWPKSSSKNTESQAGINNKPTDNVEIVNRIFTRFGLIYADAWSVKLKNESWKKAMKHEWLEVIASMSIEEVKEAMRYLKSPENDRFVEFPPNALQFRRISTMLKEKNIPSVDECYHAAVFSNWDLHPIVKPAAEACDLFWFKTQASDYDGRKRFSGYYVMMKEKYLRGEPLFTPKAIESTPVKPKRELSLSEKWHLKLAEEELERKRLKGLVCKHESKVVATDGSSKPPIPEEFRELQRRLLHKAKGPLSSCISGWIKKLLGRNDVV